MTNADVQPAPGLTCLLARAGSGLAIGALLGFFAGSALVVLHPGLSLVASDQPLQARQLLQASLAILPRAIWVSMAAGACCGVSYSLLQSASPELSLRISRSLWPLCITALCLALMFGYDADVFGYRWFRAAKWAVIAFLLAATGRLVATTLVAWLQRGALTRMMILVALVGAILWVPVVFRLLLR